MKIDLLKWYIDIDLSPSKHVSPQHALIAFNFEKMWYFSISLRIFS